MAPFALPELEAQAIAPSFEVIENKDAFLFEADVPGIKQEDLEITVTGQARPSPCPRSPDTQSKKIAISTGHKS